jgi:hypothetical protein
MIKFYKNKLLILFLVSVINISCSESAKAFFGTREIVSGVSAVAGALCFSKTDTVLQKLFPELYERAKNGDSSAVKELRNVKIFIKLVSGLFAAGGGYVLLKPCFVDSSQCFTDHYCGPSVDSWQRRPFDYEKAMEHTIISFIQGGPVPSKTNRSGQFFINPNIFSGDRLLWDCQCGGVNPFRLFKCPSCKCKRPQS